MPIYEYRCADCKKRTSLLILNLRNPPALACKFCQGTRLERILSKFAAPKSEEARLESLADPSNLGGLDENDPRSMARFMKKMGSEFGEDLDGDIEEAMEEAGSEGTASDTSDMD